MRQKVVGKGTHRRPQRPGGAKRPKDKVWIRAAKVDQNGCKGCRVARNKSAPRPNVATAHGKIRYARKIYYIHTDNNVRMTIYPHSYIPKK